VIKLYTHRYVGLIKKYQDWISFR